MTPVFTLISPLQELRSASKSSGASGGATPSYSSSHALPRSPSRGEKNGSVGREEGGPLLAAGVGCGGGGQRKANRRQLAPLPLRGRNGSRWKSVGEHDWKLDQKETPTKGKFWKCNHKDADLLSWRPSPEVTRMKKATAV